MPYRMKNRFLILGITGPLGAGCTTTAKFLSGQIEGGVSVKELISTLKDKTDNLNTRIKHHYNRIDELKKRIDERLSKNLGPYKQDLLNPKEDSIVKRHEKNAKKNHEYLKIYLRRREVTDILAKFIDEKAFDYDNLHELDRQVFGVNPFVYISFTHIIVKLAVETFCGQDGINNFNRYFEEKQKGLKDNGSAEIYNNIKLMIGNEFKTIERNYKRHFMAVQYIQDRDYKIINRSLLKKNTQKKEEKKDLNRKRIIDFYNYFNAIVQIHNRVKDFVSGKDNQGYNYAISDILQDWGDNCRATKNPFIVTNRNPNTDKIYTLSIEINTIIKFLRFRLRCLDNEFNMVKDDDNNNTPSLFVVECFRNPFEAEFFRSRYSEFYLMSISADLSVRQKRVKTFSPDREKRDQGDTRKTPELYKLDVRSCVLNSDIAILNDRNGKKSLIGYFEKILRCLALIRSPGCIPPTEDELYMQIAYSHSLKSNCISRKVGAVILGPEGYILGAGWNDVGEGQVGCGFRQKKDYLEIKTIPKVSSVEDLPTFEKLINKSKGDHVCFKDITSKIHISKELDKIDNDECCEGNCLDKIKNELGIKRLEYCRALHAEENALLQISKVGGMSIKGGTIYTTTYPCELCAKKLYQIGIRTVYYTEPYPESISDEVFFKDGNRSIQLIPFEGVKSYSYFKLYKPIFDKKEMSVIESIVT